MVYDLSEGEESVVVVVDTIRRGSVTSLSLGVERAGGGTVNFSDFFST